MEQWRWSEAFACTVSTLQFADRAKKVVLHTSINEQLDDPSLVRRYEHQIARLKALLQDAVRGNSGTPSTPAAGSMQASSPMSFAGACICLGKRVAGLTVHAATANTRNGRAASRKR